MFDNLKDAIAYDKEVAENWKSELVNCVSGEGRNKIKERVAEHEQRAEWLTELQERREADRWISVKERLPENDEYVLVYDNSDMFVAWFSKEWGWCSFDGNLDEYTPIIAWRPLPKAPESEDK